MLADVIQLVDEQLEASQREIADVRSILADAVARLMRDRCDRSDTPLASAGNAGTDAVTALQFQDLSDQLLAHAMSRLDVLRGEVKQVRGGLVNSCVTRGEDPWHSVVTSVHYKLTAFAGRHNRPVGAAHLEPGSIELF